MTITKYRSADLKLELAQELRIRLVEAAWHQGDYFTDKDGRACYCLVGAMASLLAGPEASSNDLGQYEVDAGEFIAAACPEFKGNRGTQSSCGKIIDWNDDKQRTWQQVDTVVNRVVAYYRAELARDQRMGTGGFV